MGPIAPSRKCVVSTLLLLASVSCKSSSGSRQNVLAEATDKAAVDSAKKGVTQVIEAIGWTPVNAMAEALNQAKEQILPLQLQLLNGQHELARQEKVALNLERLRTSYSESQRHWELLQIFAGKDGLLNYGDVVKTLQCLSDLELRRLLNEVLQQQADQAQGYKRTAILRLQGLIANNLRIPAYTDSIQLGDLFSKEGIERLVDNQINLRTARLFEEQCKVSEHQLREQGLFDVIKSHCLEALEWRAQGLLFGLFGLRPGSLSHDGSGSTCDGRRVTVEALAQVAAVGVGKDSAEEFSPVLDFARIQSAKYFGSWASGQKTNKELSVRSPKLSEQLAGIRAPFSLQIVGGIPVAAFKRALDLLLTNAQILPEDLTKAVSVSHSLKFQSCSIPAIRFVGKEKKGAESLDRIKFVDENHLRAALDPAFTDWRNELAKRHKGDELRYAIAEAEQNRVNAVLFREPGEPIRYTHQAINNIDLLGKSSYFGTQTFLKQANGSFVLDFVEMEQEIDGHYLASKFTGPGLIEKSLEGYGVPLEEYKATVEPCAAISITR